MDAVSPGQAGCPPSHLGLSLVPMLISAYSTRHLHCPHGFPGADDVGKWDESGAAEAELVNHLGALADHVRANSAGLPGEQAQSLLRHVDDTQRWYTFTLDETDPAQLVELDRWATEANAILLVDGALLDGHGRPLFAGGHGAASGVVPVLAESSQRAGEVRRWLAAQRHVQVPATLAPVRSSVEVQLQDAEQVGLRLIALVMTSDFAASLIAGHHIDPRVMAAAFPRSFASLSPAELALFERRKLWAAHTLRPRIEAAQELLWATGRMTLGWPNRACPADEVKTIVLAGGEEGFLEGLVLRPTAELLDEYECLVSLMFAIDEQHRGKGTPVPDTNLGICAERLSAISWLMNRGLTWDDADHRDRSL